MGWPPFMSRTNRFAPIPQGGILGIAKEDRIAMEHSLAASEIDCAVVHGEGTFRHAHSDHSDNETSGHNGHAGHAGHGDHVEVFRRRFWWSLLLTVPIVATS